MYYEKSIIKDVNEKPIPQYWNPITQQYEVVQSENNTLRVNIVDENGNQTHTQNLVDQITVKIDELIEVVK